MAPVQLRGLTGRGPAAGASARGALADLLTRVLDKGVLLDADAVITLAGVPLAGIVLRAVVGGMETLRSYGILAEWDDALRRRVREPAAARPAGPESRTEVC